MVLPVVLALVAIAGVAAAWVVARAEQVSHLQEAFDATHRARLAAEQGVFLLLAQLEGDGSLPFDPDGRWEMQPKIEVTRWTGERIQPASATVMAWDESGKVNINFANDRLLQELPGFDARTVSMVSTNRARNGNALSVWELEGLVPDGTLEAYVTHWGPPSLQTADPEAFRQAMIKWGVGALEARRIAEELAMIQGRVSLASGEIEDSTWGHLASPDSIPNALASMGRVTWETVRSRLSFGGMVNVNTAPLEVLRALARASELPESEAVALERSRRNAPFRNLSDVRNRMAGHDSVAVDRFLAYLSTETSMVGVISSAEVAGWNVTIRAVIWSGDGTVGDSSPKRHFPVILEWIETG